MSVLLPGLVLDGGILRSLIAVGSHLSPGEIVGVSPLDLARFKRSVRWERGKKEKKMAEARAHGSTHRNKREDTKCTLDR